MKPTRFYRPYFALACLAAQLALLPRPAAAWSTEANMIVALVADRLLQTHDQPARKRVAAILASDKDNDLTGTDIASEASWAAVLLDKSPEGRAATAQWHYLKLDPTSPDFVKACQGHPDLPAMTPAAHGPQKACIIDKINQFARELSDPSTSAGERLRALQFLLALTADLHQPLDIIDRGDDAGDCSAILLPGARAPVRLAAYWNDTLVAEAEGRDPVAAADRIVAGLTPSEIAKWSDGTLETWARESYDLAKTVAYNFPADARPVKLSRPRARVRAVAAPPSPSIASMPIIASAPSPRSGRSSPRPGCASPFCSASTSADSGSTGAPAVRRGPIRRRPRSHRRLRRPKSRWRGRPGQRVGR